MSCIYGLLTSKARFFLKPTKTALQMLQKVLTSCPTTLPVLLVSSPHSGIFPHKTSLSLRYDGLTLRRSVCKSNFFGLNKQNVSIGARSLQLSPSLQKHWLYQKQPFYCGLTQFHRRTHTHTGFCQGNIFLSKKVNFLA